MINVLIVEDDKTQRETFISMVKELGNNYNIIGAEDAESALIILAASNINLFFIDINLGTSLGIDLAYKIRENSKSGKSSF